MKSKTALQILKDARELIASPAAWTKGAACRVIDGKNSYCASGAVYAASRVMGRVERRFNSPREAALLTLRKGIAGVTHHPEIGVIAFNDALDRTHAQVLRAFDLAIAKFEKAASNSK